MRENPVTDIATLAADEALEYAREAETLDAEIEDLYRNDPQNRRAIGQANARLGLALKLAEVHANLAIAEQLVGLRVDLNTTPPAPQFSKGGVFDLAESVGGTTYLGERD